MAYRAEVLIAAGAMVAAALAVAAPAGASAGGATGSALQASLAGTAAAPELTPTPISTTTIAGWADTTSMATPRIRHASALLKDGRVLVAGGFDGTTTLSSSELYDPTTSTWQAAANMPRPVADASAVTLGDGTVLVAGGAGVSTEIYHPTTNTWTVGPNMRNPSVGTTFAASWPDGKVFLLSASAANVYNPVTKKWKALARPPAMDQKRNDSTTMLPNGDVITTNTMQYYGSMPPIPSTGPSVYHRATNKWTTLPVPPGNVGTGVEVAALPNGNAILAGGYVAYLEFPAIVLTVVEVNPVTGTWTYDADLPRGNAIDGSEFVELSNGSILATGGYGMDDPYYVNPDYVYTPSAGTWTEVEGRNTDSGSTTTLADGSVLSTGGYAYDYYTGRSAVKTQAAIFTPGLPH